MSEETGTAEDGQEPSMEDILASIRRILSENDEAKIAAVEAELHPEAAGSNVEAEQPSTDAKASVDEANAETQIPSEPDAETEPSLGANSTAEQDSISDPNSGQMYSERSGSIPPVMESILDLTPDMIASEIISEPTAQTSTDVLSELAAAILDRRDMAVDASSQDMTLEGIVREMLKPILREWLDRNLPYLIERLVKREIDLMVNRAERLEE